MMSSMMGAPSNYVSIGVGMGVKDRTKEFAAACERAAKTPAAAGGPGGAWRFGRYGAAPNHDDDGVAPVPGLFWSDAKRGA